MSLLEISNFTSNLWLDIRYAGRCLSNIDKIFSKKYPKLSFIPLATTSLVSAVALGLGTSALGGYSIGRIIHIFSTLFKPGYGATAGGVLFTSWFLSELSNWVTWNIQETVHFVRFARESLPAYVKNKGSTIEITPLKDMRKQAYDFLYRRLYDCYELAGDRRQPKTYIELIHQLEDGLHLLVRNLSEGLTEDERKVLFDGFNAKTRAEIIQEAKTELLHDICKDLKLTPIYEEVIRRAKPEERKAVENKLNALPHKDSNIYALLKALEKGKWDAPIFSNIDFPYYALEALRRGRLSQNDFATVQIFWEITQMHPDKSTRRAIPIFHKNGSINAEAKELILQTFTFNEKNVYFNSHQHLKNHSYLTPGQIDEFFEKVKKLPKSEQTIWIVPNIEGGIIEEIVPRMNVFSRVETSSLMSRLFLRPKETKMMVASLGLMQTYLDIQFGQNAVQMNPVLGLSSWGDIRQNHLEGKRDYANHFPGIALPEKADTHLAPWYFFGKHDFYHAVLVSGALLNFRKIFVKGYDILQWFHKLVWSVAKPDIGTALLDLEAIHCRRALFSSSGDIVNDVFWTELAHLIARSAYLNCLAEIKEGTEPAPEATADLYTDLIFRRITLIPEIQKGPFEAYRKVSLDKERNPLEVRVLKTLCESFKRSTK